MTGPQNPAGVGPRRPPVAGPWSSPVAWPRGSLVAGPWGSPVARPQPLALVPSDPQSPPGSVGVPRVPQPYIPRRSSLFPLPAATRDAGLPMLMTRCVSTSSLQSLRPHTPGASVWSGGLCRFWGPGLGPARQMPWNSTVASCLQFPKLQNQAFRTRVHF